MMLNGGRESILCRLDTTATDLGLLLSSRDEQEGRRNQEIFGKAENLIIMCYMHWARIYVRRKTEWRWLAPFVRLARLTRLTTWTKYHLCGLVASDELVVE